MSTCFWCDGPLSEDGTCKVCAAHPMITGTTNRRGSMIKTWADLCIDGSKSETIGDLREFLRLCEQFGVPDSQVMDDTLFVIIRSSSIALTHCADHAGGTFPVDAVVMLHDCKPGQE